jgi:hypothetical protein
MDADSQSEQEKPNQAKSNAGPIWAGVFTGTLVGCIFLGRQIYSDWDYWPAARKFDWSGALITLSWSIPKFAFLSSLSAWQAGKRQTLLSGAFIGAIAVGLICLPVPICCLSLESVIGLARPRGQEVTIAVIWQWFLHVYLPVGIVSGLVATASRQLTKGESKQLSP